MTTEGTPTIDLAFGYRRLPEGVTTAWGARWNITQDGVVDQVADRTDTCGPDDKLGRLLAHLSATVGNCPRFELARLLRFELSTREDREVTLYEDETVVVVGSPQSSGGYFYVSAYLRDEIALVATGDALRTARLVVARNWRLANFFGCELHYEGEGGAAPSTVGSALDSLAQAPDDLVQVMFTGDTGGDCTRGLIDFAVVMRLVGPDTELRDVLTRYQSRTLS